MALGAELLCSLCAGQWLQLPPTSMAALQLAAAFARPGEDVGEKSGACLKHNFLLESI